MKRLISLATLATLVSVATIAQARDLGPDEALRLRDAGTIKSFEQLNEAALAQHPGARIEETELEDEYGRYIYQIELRDAQGVRVVTDGRAERFDHLVLACHSDLALALPEGTGQVEKTGTLVTISVRWNDNRGRIKAADDTDTGIETFVYRTEI